MLYPVTNTKRTAISLNGLWNFSFIEDDYIPFKPLPNPRPIGVPSSYNDLFTTTKEREYVGCVAYEKTIDIPDTLEGTWRLRIGAAGNRVTCYINGEEVYAHEGGFLPLDFEVPSTSSCRITIVMDNRLDYQSLPVGSVGEKNNKLYQTTHFDFFHYTGLHRNVFLYHLPSNPIQDITIKTSLGDIAQVQYTVKTESDSCEVALVDPNGVVLDTLDGQSNTFNISNPVLWDIGQGNLYQLNVTTDTDSFTETFGIRSVEVKDSMILLNGKSIYLKGFGMHEDHITVGRGHHSGLAIRDFELLKWIHANSFRTSHYPYDEELYYLADRYGILIINEVPAVGMNFWSSTAVFSDDIINDITKQNHMNQLSELVARDKNHPSVIMYSIANEANTHEGGALAYFNDIFAHARTLTNLPLMIVEWVGAEANKVAQLADVIGLNRYIGWYTDFADLDVVGLKLKQNLQEYYDTFKKPIIMTEFGTDTIAGLHSLPAVAFSEEFQLDFIKLYKTVFDELDFVVGEHIWNFADFMTKQGLTRINGNKKGVFTRDRQPKMVAHYLKETWKP